MAQIATLISYNSPTMSKPLTPEEMIEVANVETWSKKYNEGIAVLKEIANKECYHAYPSSVMVDVCEACKARVFLQATKHYDA